jgi:hypothetical protein
MNFTPKECSCLDIYPSSSYKTYGIGHSAVPIR